MRTCLRLALPFLHPSTYPSDLEVPEPPSPLHRTALQLHPPSALLRDNTVCRTVKLKFAPLNFILYSTHNAYEIGLTSVRPVTKIVIEEV
jgi:hypothetical protein